MTAWRRLELALLAGTIPAFYMALLSSHRLASASLYALACAATAIVARQERAAGGRAGQHCSAGVERLPQRLLIAGLVLSAMLRPGDDPFALAVRLATAALTVMHAAPRVRPWLWRRGLPQLLAIGVAVLGLSGLGFWWLEPNARSFGDGLWLAFTTAATVGYGDIVPSTPAAKIFAVFVVLTGFAVISTVTAAIAAQWVQTEERRIEREMLHDLHGQLRVIRAELAALRHEAATRARPAERGSAGSPVSTCPE